MPAPDGAGIADEWGHLATEPGGVAGVQVDFVFGGAQAEPHIKAAPGRGHAATLSLVQKGVRQWIKHTV